MPALVLATRGSPLARWQAERVASLLAAVPGAPPIEVLVVQTTGDRLPHVGLSALGGQGVFAKEVQQAVLDGRADLAVHSAKDLPAATPDGLVLAAVPERADPRDALSGSRLADIPTGGVVATSSPRRRAQLAWRRPDLRFIDIRGNIARRLDQRGSVGAVVVALAALQRLGLAGEAAEVLDPAVVLPQVGQGALAVECRAGDATAGEVLLAVDDPVAHRAVDAERAFLAAVGGGCRAAVGALAVPTGAGNGSGEGEAVGTGLLRLDVVLAGGDGHVVLRHRVTGGDPARLGRDAARALVEEHGAAAVGDLVGSTAIGGLVGSTAGATPAGPP